MLCIATESESICSDRMFCKALVIFTTPAIPTLFPSMLKLFISMLLDNTAAISSPTSPLMLLSEISRCLSEEILCNALAILVAPEAFKLLFLILKVSNLVLQHKATAISPAASLPILLNEISNLLRDEMLDRPLAM